MALVSKYCDMIIVYNKNENESKLKENEFAKFQFRLFEQMNLIVYTYLF